MGRHQSRVKRRHAAALKSMSKEAKQLSEFIANLRKYAHNIDDVRGRVRTSDDPALGSNLDIRRKNLAGTIDVLEDRLSAIRGLIKLDRPHVEHRWH
jgi:hypothetical protein